ncbi:hypothetical protein ARAM_006518 [Aspergillus rambellii]|uniref:Tubby C-terminal-like domain-containing protein n=2 Tax=Aspergillus subgen. Nidulantes TaxID=2720870 RepID=A0A0F8UMV1_9EURO|nr:hypothetical protein ARAM_006518 [Aspergillus rambellii]KKK15093.1 hypothetical protein AOCH_005602 [Aspergillus ochraceoroseus]
MLGGHARARMNRLNSSGPRKALKAPDRPIAVRQEYITDLKTTLAVIPQGDARAVTAYRIHDADGVTQFTVSGRKYNGGRFCREFRDASGLPLFELHRKISLTSSSWAVTLPGSRGGHAELATGAPRLSFGTAVSGNFSLTFDNVAALATKRPEEKALTLVIERHGNILESFDVVDGDRKVAEVRESILYNKKLALRASSRRCTSHRPAMDVLVTPGVDMSLITIIAIIASDSVFASE